MSLQICLLAAVFSAGLFSGTKSESFIFGLKQLEACLQKQPLSMNCKDEVCVLKKCLKVGYDLLFENSSYGLHKDYDISRTAHCAIDNCVKGVLERNDVTDGLFSGWTEPILGCLHSVSRCVKYNPRDEL